MTTRPTLIQLLRSNTFAVWIAIASVIVQSFHSFYAFYKISSLNGSGWGIAQAVLFAVIVDCAVLFYTVRKNTKVTWMAAFVMVLINLYVYYTHLGLTFDFMLGVLISFVIPVSNYFYSEEIDDTMEVDYESGDREEILRLEKLLEKAHETVLNTEEESKREHRKQLQYISELRDSIKSRDEVILAFRNGQLKPIAPESDLSNDHIDNLVDKVSKGFASLKSPAQEEAPPSDKSLLGVDKIIATDRPNPPLQ